MSKIGAHKERRGGNDVRVSPVSQRVFAAAGFTVLVDLPIRHLGSVVADAIPVVRCVAVVVQWNRQRRLPRRREP